MLAFGVLLDRLRAWDDPGLADMLSRLQERGDLWVAPRLGQGRSAISVRSLVIKPVRQGGRRGVTVPLNRRR